MATPSCATAALQQQQPHIEQPFDPREFRMALGSFATGVTVVTTLDKAGRDVGVTASSFNSVSLDPPLILWSLDRNAYCMPAFNQASHFIVNVLAADQVGLSNRFARLGADKFIDLDVNRGINNIASLPDVSARFECAVEHRYDGGDHVILVGRVLAYARSERAGLVFQQGRYAIGADHPDSQREPITNSGEGGFVRGFLPYITGRCHQALMESFALALQDSPLTASQYRVLFSLRESETGTVTHLCELSLLGENVVDLALTALSKKGLVAVSQGSAAVTEQGLAVLAEAEATLLAWENKMLARMPDTEAAALKVQLDRLSERCIRSLAGETIGT